MVTGQGEGGVMDDKVYFGAGGSVPDTKGPLVRAVQTPSPLPETPTVIRYALRDNVTNEQGQMIKTTSVTYNIAGGASKTVTGTFYGGDLFRATIPAQVAGTVVSFRINATDRASNTSTSPALASPALTYTVPTPVPPPVVIGVGGSGGAGGGGGATAGSGGTGGATAGAGGASAGSGGSLAGGGGAAGSDETGEAGEAGETSVGGSSSRGGSSSGTAGKPSTGKAGSSSIGGGTGEAGESSAGTAGKGHYETVDDGGCSVSSSTPASKSRGAALLGFGLAMLGLVRRRRNNKQ
jgi:MYXO-CTERM domain-containing protein